MMPRAPAAMALSTYRLPSVVPPFMATKIEPGRTRRESYSMPVMGWEEEPEEPTAVISAMRSGQSMSVVIVDGDNDVGSDLGPLETVFTCEQRAKQILYLPPPS